MTAPRIETGGRAVGVPARSGVRPWPRSRDRVTDPTYRLAVAVLLLLLLAVVATPALLALGWLDPYTPDQSLVDDYGRPAVGVSWSHWLGVEPGLGRDVLSRLWTGTAVSVAVAASATAVAVGLGLAVGLVSGMRGGWVDALLGRVVELTLAFPVVLLLVALDLVAVTLLVEVLGLPEGNVARAVYVVLVLGLFGWTGVARVVRSQVLVLAEQEFVHAARAFGAREVRIWVKEVLPNVRSTVVVQATLLLPAFVTAEAAIGYLGVGLRTPLPTLGNMVEDALRHPEAAPVYFFAPAVVVALLVVALNVAGDGLRDRLDGVGRDLS